MTFNIYCIYKNCHGWTLRPSSADFGLRYHPGRANRRSTGNDGYAFNLSCVNQAKIESKHAPSVAHVFNSRSRSTDIRSRTGRAVRSPASSRHNQRTLPNSSVSATNFIDFLISQHAYPLQISHIYVTQYRPLGTFQEGGKSDKSTAPEMSRNLTIPFRSLSELAKL